MLISLLSSFSYERFLLFYSSPYIYPIFYLASFRFNIFSFISRINSLSSSSSSKLSFLSTFIEDGFIGLSICFFCDCVFVAESANVPLFCNLLSVPSFFFYAELKTNETYPACYFEFPLMMSISDESAYDGYEAVSSSVYSSISNDSSELIKIY